MPLTLRPSLAVLTLAFSLAAAGGIQAQESAPTEEKEEAVKVILPPGPEDVGAYIAARVAESNSNYREAAAWYTRALLADPGNAALIEGGLYAQLALGDFAKARVLAEGLGDAAKTNQLAGFALSAHAAGEGDFAALITAAKDGRTLGPVLDELILAWSLFGEGNVSDAMKEFAVITDMRGMEAVGLYHNALALALAGDFEGAEGILSGKVAGPLTLNRRGVIAHVQILSQLERNADAIALLEKSFGPDPEPLVNALRSRLAAGEPIPFDMIPNAKAGMAEAFFTIGTLLQGEADPAYVLLHSRVANHLDAGNGEAVLLTAQSLEELKQFDLAVETYGLIPKDSPLSYSAEIGRSDALYADGQKDAAIEALQGLTISKPDLIIAHSSLADILRREDRCADAVTSYNAAIGLVTKVEGRHWTLFFSRGICHEKVKDWEKAEADFRRALELNPGQPQVLNYLGYSLVDRGLKLDEALGLIEQAVRAEPEAGYIIDSLAWAYFRLGRYEDALAPMEKASVLEPVDPIVTDHLGDVYWMVGRKREAEFQWHRALSFNPEEKEAIRIRRKLEVGLDVVMQDEGAAPAEPPADGN